MYVDDLGFGYPPHRRGHWADRLPTIEQDLAFMERLVNQESTNRTDQVITALLKPRPSRPPCRHAAPPSFVPGQSLDFEVTSSRSAVERMRIHYLHANQAEAYQVENMTPAGESSRFQIPATYTDTAFPLLYFFELRDGKKNAWLYPDLNAEVPNQPYFTRTPGGA
jgi:hypothetical protein